MPVTITRRHPPAPTKAAILHGLPVAAGTLVPLADGLNGLAGWRALRSASWTVDHGAATASDVSAPYIRTVPPAGPLTTRVWLQVGDIAQALQVSLVYQAVRAPSAVPSIKVELYRLGGAFRDAIIWDGAAAVATLPTGSRRDGRYPLVTATAPMRIDSSAVDDATPTRPRLLNLDGDARQTMELRITTTNARLLFAYAVEAYQEVVG